MKFSFGTISAVLVLSVPLGLAMANENEQLLGYTPVVIFNKNLRSSKKNIHFSPSSFSKVKGTAIFEKLSHQAYVHVDTNRIENDKSIGDAVGNDDDDGIGGTDDDKKLNSSSYHSRQGVDEGGKYDEENENKIAMGGLLDVLVGVCVCVCVGV